jgi:hypothetical protein
MHCKTALLVLAVAATWSATATAASPNLKGAYGFTGTAACLVAPGNSATPPVPGNTTPNADAGFNARLQPNDALPPPAVQKSFTRSFSVEGIRTFNGDGTGTVKGTAVGIVGRPTPGPPGFPNFPPSAGSADFQFSFTYTVNGDGSFTATMVPGSYSEIFTSGPRFTPVQQTATVDAIPPVTGMISLDGKTLVLAHLETAVEVHTYSNGDVWPEICHRSRVLIQLKNDNN